MGNRLSSAWRAGVHSLGNDGLVATLRKGRTYVGQRYLGARPDLTQHRYLLSERLAKELDYTVAYGPFTGLKLSPESWWSAADRGSMLLGMYEQEVLSALASLSEGRTTLVDVGAADGYYAVGAVRSGLYAKAICFEISADGREVIRVNAERNGVMDRMTILGEASSDFLAEMSSLSWDGTASTVFLFDIEGGEFEILTREVLESLRSSTLLIEIHEPMNNVENKTGALIKNAQGLFDVEVMTTGARNPGAFSELRTWTDDDRWLLCSESRAYLMRWLVLTPKN